MGSGRTGTVVPTAGLAPQRLPFPGREQTAAPVPHLWTRPVTAQALGCGEKYSTQGKQSLSVTGPDSGSARSAQSCLIGQRCPL